ncbi:hypothetical protein GF343_00270 [Candidatus Woesearchaeota archaeon]|nr:hypothetical protein [Candidatus Woesearchaeota archaeon]
MTLDEQYENIGDSEKRYLRLGTVSLGKKEIRRNLGRKCADELDKLYVLAVEGGNIRNKRKL